MLGEVIDENNNCFDIQLKGSGKTKFSRSGDGRAGLASVIREYILSDSMHNLGIKTTRALAICLTGEEVYRESIEKGAIFTRVASSHIRVGTFEYFATRSDDKSIKKLADYAINRHYPECLQAKNF